MKQFIACLLLGALLGIIPPPLPAQQNQNQEMEALKKRVSELEKQLQTVENVEKLDLQAKLAEANAKLANAEFGKFERELRNSNHKWLTEWILLFLAILSAVGIGVWSWLKSRTNQLIENEVEKNLKGFKDAVEEQNVIKNQLGVLEKEYAATILDREFIHFYFEDEQPHPEQIKALREKTKALREETKALREETILQVFNDEIYGLRVRYTAAGVLASRKSPQLVAPLLEFLNSAVDSDSEEIHFGPGGLLRGFVNFLAYIHTQETYQGLTKFLSRLLTENPKHKDLFLTFTVFSLGWVSIQLDKSESVSILRRAIPHLKDLQLEHESLKKLAEHFNKFNEPEGIKEILRHHGTTILSEVKEKCLELLQKHDPEFVAKWRAREITENNA